MLTARPTNVHVEIVHWILLVVLAILMLLALATAAAGADPMREPGRLPDDMDAVAKPMKAEPIAPFFPEVGPRRQLPPAEAVARLWATLDHHRAGRLGEALAGWEQLRLPEETAHWAEIAVGAAYLRAGDTERAAMHLTAARQLAPGNAVVAYFMGLLRLEQAAAVGRLPDDLYRRDRLVAYTPLEERAVFRLMARGELQQAIAAADLVRLDERLLPADPAVEEAVVVPAVADLLRALGADNFVGKAHQLLFGLHLDQGELGDAEFHLDRAAATGVAVLDGYQELAVGCLDAGRTADALRLLRKHLAATEPWLADVCQRLLGPATVTQQPVWVW